MKQQFAIINPSPWQQQNPSQFGELFDTKEDARAYAKSRFIRGSYRIITIKEGK